MLFDLLLLSTVAIAINKISVKVLTTLFIVHERSVGTQPRCSLTSILAVAFLACLAKPFSLMLENFQNPVVGTVFYHLLFYHILCDFLLNNSDHKTSFQRRITCYSFVIYFYAASYPHAMLFFPTASYSLSCFQMLLYGLNRHSFELDSLFIPAEFGFPDVIAHNVTELVRRRNESDLLYDL